jgi:pimeloyl-ACP methyl ester carboxylesterase
MPVMKVARCGLLAIAIFFCFGAPSASANTTNLSVNPSYATGPFLFYCEQYTTTFESGKHYQPIDGSCAFSIPSTITGNKVIAVYKGTPGNAAALAGDAYFGSATLVQEDFVPFGSPVQDDDYFAAVYDLSLYTSLNNYFQSGGPVPTGAVENQNYYILPWKWGFKPPSEYDPVVIIPGILGSWEKNGSWVLDPILHTYDNLIDTFLANGYVENKTLFKFPYDWEEPNEDTAYILKNKIADIKTICQCQHVDLIGHSMGGLVALSYIESDGYANDVDQLFLVATPLSGAPKAYKAWEGGDLDFGGVIENAFLKTKFNIEALKNGYTKVYDYIHGKPIVSIQELLPVFSDYLKINTVTLHYPSGYPANLFIEQIVSNLDSKVYRRGVDVNIILADDKTNTTIGGFIVASSTKPGLWMDGQPTSTILVAGDGTVPRSSIEKYVNIDKEFDFENHNGVASTSSPYIFEVLNGKTVSTTVGKTYSVVGSFLRFSLLSPIDMQIIAPDGKRLGKDFSTNTELNEIPDAFYSGFNTDTEYAVILNPLPGIYKLETIGTGAGGHYTIVADYADTATTSEAQVSGTTTPAQIISNTVITSPTAAISITVDVPAPPPTLTPDTCLTDMTRAYQNKWITKKAIYDGLIFDCKTLKTLFATRDKVTGNLLTTVLTLIKLTLGHMDLLAKDKTNTQDAVLLIHAYTTWFRAH